MSERNQTESANDVDRVDDAVDPRVQIELERLNTATDDINKLEVDLDEARATFRELVRETTMTIEALNKKLSTCIEKSQPYYDARFKAKEALQEAQKAAIRFERANGQHAAAKEMVYLAEEGLRMEGRCFDHAWQEMLNHATERVNESEHERAISEAEHRHMTALYHNAEHNVKRLQSELKRSIAKSRPYYEMKAQFNQATERHKLRLTELERSIAEAKMTYAEALRNLEKISDEIHRTRQYDGASKDKNSTQQDQKDINKINKVSSSESSTTGSPDSTDYTSDEYLRLPEEMSPTSPSISKVQRDQSSEYLGLNNINLSSTEPRKYIKRDRPLSTTSLSLAKNPSTTTQTTSSSNSMPRLSGLPVSPSSATNHQPSDRRSLQLNSLKGASLSAEKSENKLNNDDKGTQDNLENGEKWTEISLTNSPDDIYYNNDIYSDDDDQQIPYKPLPSELSPECVNIPITTSMMLPSTTAVIEPTVITKKRLINQQSLPVMPQNSEVSVEEKKTLDVTRSPSVKCRGRLDSSLSNWISRSSAGNYVETTAGVSGNSSRRQSLDMLWSAGTGERMKELLNHGMMMLNISSLTERRASEPKLLDKDDKMVPKCEKSENNKIEVKGKKVPSPLEKTMSYLNPDEETSDSESLASVEMLSEDQISSLMMEPDINQVCQEVLGTPLVEVCPLLEQFQQQ